MNWRREQGWHASSNPGAAQPGRVFLTANGRISESRSVRLRGRQVRQAASGRGAIRREGGHDGLREKGEEVGTTDGWSWEAEEVWEIDLPTRVTDPSCEATIAQRDRRRASTEDNSVAGRSSFGGRRKLSSCWSVGRVCCVGFGLRAGNETAATTASMEKEIEMGRLGRQYP